MFARFGREEGFTLGELMVGILVLTFLIFAVFGVLDYNLRSARTFKAKTELGQDLRQNLAHISDQIRVANSVVVAEEDRIVFVGYVTGGDEYEITIEKSGDTISYRSDPPLYGEEGERVLASRVESLGFSYYDASGNETSELDSISMVQIELQLRRGSEAYETASSAKSRVNLRGV